MKEKIKVLLLGGYGLLGSYFREIQNDFSNLSIFAPKKEDLDFSDFAAITEAISEFGPRFVINCAAYTDVDGAETNSADAFMLNSAGVKNLAQACEKKQATLIHFSTDYVFDGENPAGYIENDEPNPINIYGESKLKGEAHIAEVMSKFYIVRTAWLFGKYGRNFVDTMRKLALERTHLSVVNDQVGSPTYALDLAKAVIENFILSEPDYGIYHMTNSGKASWFELAKEIFLRTGTNNLVKPVSSAEFPRPARRPAFSILQNTKLPLMRDYREALSEYLSITP